MHLASSSPNALAFYSRFCSKRYVVTDCEEALGLLRNSGFDAFIPLVPEPTLLDLAKRKAEVEKDAVVMCGERDVMNNLIDKKLMTDTSRKLKIPVPTTIFPKSDSEVEKFVNRHSEVMLKFRKSSGGGGVYRLKNFQDYQNLRNNLNFAEDDVIIQEYVTGKQIGVSVMMDRSFNLVAAFVNEELRCNPHPFGPPSYVRTIKRRDCVEYSEKLLRKVGYCGVAHLDFVIGGSDDTPMLIDVNPRFWDTLNASVICGIDFPWLALQLFTGEKLSEQIYDYDTDVHIRSILDDFRSMLTILKSNDHPSSHKLEQVMDFLKFFKYKDIIFDPLDPVPVLVKTLKAITKAFGRAGGMSRAYGGVEW